VVRRPGTPGLNTTGSAASDSGQTTRDTRSQHYEQRDAATGSAASDGGQTTRDTRSQHYDEPEHRLTRVMSGCLDNLPPLQPKVVRIFTSSTFTGESTVYSYTSLFTNAELIETFTVNGLNSQVKQIERKLLIQFHEASFCRRRFLLRTYRIGKNKRCL